MRIKSLATDINLDLNSVLVEWDANARKRDATVQIKLKSGEILELWEDGHFQLWGRTVPGHELFLSGEGSLWSGNTLFAGTRKSGPERTSSVSTETKSRWDLGLSSL